MKKLSIFALLIASSSPAMAQDRARSLDEIWGQQPVQVISPVEIHGHLVAADEVSAEALCKASGFKRAVSYESQECQSRGFQILFLQNGVTVFNQNSLKPCGITGVQMFSSLSCAG